MPRKKEGAHEPTTRRKPPGLKDLPVPGFNDLRPSQRSAEEKDGPGRDVLRFAAGNRMVHNIGGDPGQWPATSPASARYTVGLRKNPSEKSVDPASATIQPGIPRVR